MPNRATKSDDGVDFCRANLHLQKSKKKKTPIASDKWPPVLSEIQTLPRSPGIGN